MRVASVFSPPQGLHVGSMIRPCRRDGSIGQSAPLGYPCLVHNTSGLDGTALAKGLPPRWGIKPKMSQRTARASPSLSATLSCSGMHSKDGRGGWWYYPGQMSRAASHSKYLHELWVQILSYHLKSVWPWTA